ncbi:MAG: hypothetical protein H6Q13_3445 [Bacteroidetes bacterium]|nr:hypothetical protein [Bacteroidota bacterium]
MIFKKRYNTLYAKQLQFDIFYLGKINICDIQTIRIFALFNIKKSLEQT